MLNLLASNCKIGSFFSTISTLYDIAHPLKAWSVFITLSCSVNNGSMFFELLTGLSMGLL